MNGEALTRNARYGIQYGMPATKSTFTLDSASIERLNRLAQRWQVSKTEVLRRALAKAEQGETRTPEERLAALSELQASLKRRNVDFEEWKRVIKDGRR